MNIPRVSDPQKQTTQSNDLMSALLWTLLIIGSLGLFAHICVEIIRTGAWHMF